jgi:hypothetical protein
MSNASASPSDFPSFMDNACGLYRAEPRNFLFGFLAQATVAILLLVALYLGRDRGIKPQPGMILADVGPISFPYISNESGGHGGGGDHDTIGASRGALPKMILEDQITPPAAVLRNLDPKLPEPPSVMALSAVQLPQTGLLGDPLVQVQGPPSNGPEAALASVTDVAVEWVRKMDLASAPTIKASCSHPVEAESLRRVPSTPQAPAIPTAPAEPSCRARLSCGWWSDQMDVRAVFGFRNNWEWAWMKRLWRPSASGVSNRQP